MSPASWWRTITVTGIALAATAALAGTAHGSISAASNAQRPALRVDARGYAEVSWSEGGARKTLLIPPSGRYLPGGRIDGADVSKPTTVPGLPFARVVRRTPDGRLWALQAWQLQSGGPVDLRFSRWQGELPTVEADVTLRKLTGRAEFQGKGIYGTSPTTAGTQVTHYALVDCLRCQGATGWKRVIGVRLQGPRGTFAVQLRPAWTAPRYRVTVTGPNRGWTYAPDASVVVPAGA
jgi:hypothetical protein